MVGANNYDTANTAYNTNKIMIIDNNKNVINNVPGLENLNQRLKSIEASDQGAKADEISDVRMIVAGIRVLRSIDTSHMTGG